MKYYNLEIKEVLRKLLSSEKGLSSKEVDIRLKNEGKNKLHEVKKESNISKFLKEFKDLMIIILILAAIVSFIISIVNKEPITDSIIILAIVLLNAILGFVQELKADKAMDSLKKMQVSKVKVRRDNKIVVVNSENIVRGDILILEAGDSVPADARIIWEAALKVDEASLTGESIAVSKTTLSLEGDVALSDRNNMIYSGTNIVYGKCQAVVCEVGMNTELGKIAGSLIKEEKEITPLQRKINGISKFLSIVIVIIILIMFLVGLIKGMKLLDIIMLSISLAVAAIPEGLPAVITVTLSLGVSAMAKKKAIVRKMSSVETLGCTEIICSDKTGTITQNKMKVRELYFDNKLCQAEELSKENILFNAMVLNNDVEKNKNDYLGDPTEVALYECVEKYVSISKIRKEFKRIDELPFDSERKMMSTIHKQDNSTIIFTKGSFDSLINVCSYIYENGNVVKLTKAKKSKLKSIEEQESNKAFRILAYAYKVLDKNYEINNDLEKDLIFIGMTMMIDPPREDVKEAIALCKKAHIKPIMITGDSLSTATAIAKEIGILEKDSEAILGSELDKLSDRELKNAVKKYSVYARVSPMNKLAIVNAWKKNKKVVAMTGDGVNDAPALKAANIGVGMGITGTEVSKGVSDIVLADDSFSTIVTAVKEGRRIFDNIRNVLVYLLSSNIAEILIVFIGMLFGVEIFLPIQLLFINLVTDSIPAIALAFEKAGDDVMERQIRKKDSSFFTPFLISKICMTSIIKAIAVLLVYFVNLKVFNISIATTMAFFTLVLLEIAFSYSCRNIKSSVLNKAFFSNSYLNKSIILLIFVQVLVFFTPVGKIFNVATLNISQIMYCLVVVISIVLVDEVGKKIIIKLFKD